MATLTNSELSKIRYKNINTKEKYELLYKSGFFFEFHPELTGDWDKDCPIINGEWDFVAAINPEPIPEYESHKIISASKMRYIACSYNMQFNLDLILDAILNNAKKGKYELLIDHILCTDISTTLSELGYNVFYIYDKTKISWH